MFAPTRPCWVASPHAVPELGAALLVSGRVDGVDRGPAATAAAPLSGIRRTCSDRLFAGQRAFGVRESRKSRSRGCRGPGGGVHYSSAARRGSPPGSGAVHSDRLSCSAGGLRFRTWSPDGCPVAWLTESLWLPAVVGSEELGRLCPPLLENYTVCQKSVHFIHASPVWGVVLRYGISTSL